MLKCDGKPMLSILQELKNLTEAPTSLENSRVGDRRANGAAEKAVQTLGEQVRVVKIGIRAEGSHPVNA